MYAQLSCLQSVVIEQTNIEVHARTFDTRKQRALIFSRESNLTAEIVSTLLQHLNEC